MANELTDSEVRRYSRHLILPEVGKQGQLKLRSGSVCVIGAGGLASPVLLYLAAAGVGRIGIVDDDVVEESNLQRQVIHATPQIGLPKVASAQARIEAMNPNVKVESYNVRLTSENALDILSGYEVVVDGTDNFPTRYLVNDACELLGIPWVYGSIYRFEGQASVFNHQEGPNYRDLFPSPPPPGKVPSCAEGGVLGVLPGVIGSIQVNEVLKILLEIGESISGVLLVYDSLQMRFRGLQIGRDPNRQPVTELIDYEGFCAGVGDEGETSSDSQSARGGVLEIQEISPLQASDRISQGWSPFILDVRTPAEAEMASIPGVDALIPHVSIDEALPILPKDGDILIHCHSGVRSMISAQILATKGIEVSRLYNLQGGIEAWSLQVDDSIPRY